MMKTIYLIIIFLHGLIHLLGFFKGFGLAEVKALNIPISKPMGVIWLLGSLFFLAYGILLILQQQYAWTIGLVAVVVSQLLIILFWNDAKFGTIPNLIALVVLLIAAGQHNFNRHVQQETSRLLEASGSKNTVLVQESDLEALPTPVRTWLQKSGMMGKAAIRMGKIIQHAELKMKADQKDWMSAEAMQYTIIDVPAFLWKVDVKMNPFLFFVGRDKFEGGKGEMLIRLNALPAIVNEKGEKLDEGTMQRFLGEMVWFPSMALSPYISWEAVDDSTALATMNYRGTSGSGTFHFNAEGDFIRFTAMRYMGNAADAKKYEWVLEVEEHQWFEGIKVPSKMKASWMLDQEVWTWLRLQIIDIRYNENALINNN